MELRCMKEQALWMAIDTSTATMAGAIVRGEQLLTSVQTQSERNHSIHIMTNIEKMLKSSDVQLQELAGIVTGIGPGSYTGVRIAVTAAKTLAWTCKRPVVGVSSLAALALSGYLMEAASGDELAEQESAHIDVEQGRLASDVHVLVLPLIDARRGQVYSAAFLMDGTVKQGKRLYDDHIVLMEQWCLYWIEQLPQLKEQGVSAIACFGDVAIHESSVQKLKETAEQYNMILVSAPHSISGQAVALLGQGIWLNERIEAVEPHDLVPNYAQLTEAEVKQNAKEREEGKA